MERERGAGGGSSRNGGREGGSGEEELLRALGGFSVVVPHKCIQALQDQPLTGMRDGEHERRRRRRWRRWWSGELKSASHARRPL